MRPTANMNITGMPNPASTFVDVLKFFTATVPLKLMCVTDGAAVEGRPGLGFKRKRTNDTANPPERLRTGGGQTAVSERRKRAISRKCGFLCGQRVKYARKRTLPREEGADYPRGRVSPSGKSVDPPQKQVPSGGTGLKSENVVPA